MATTYSLLLSPIISVGRLIVCMYVCMHVHTLSLDHLREGPHQYKLCVVIFKKVVSDVQIIIPSDRKTKSVNNYFEIKVT